MINIMCWLWQQPKTRTQYTAEHVNAWARMVSDNLTIPHRLSCVTDMPEGIEIDTIPLPDDFADVDNDRWPASRGLPQCYRRLSMFAPDAAERFGERFVSMDLDCVVAGNMDSLFDRDDDFVMYEGTSPKRPYNGSLMMMNAGARTAVYERFTEAGAKAASRVYVGSDQAWIAYALGWLEATWGEDDGVYFWQGGLQKRMVHDKPPPENIRLLFFPGAKIKPWHSDNRWIRSMYGTAD